MPVGAFCRLPNRGAHPFLYIKDFELLGFSTLMVMLNYGMKVYVCMKKLNFPCSCRWRSSGHHCLQVLKDLLQWWIHETICLKFETSCKMFCNNICWLSSPHLTRERLHYTILVQVIDYFNFEIKVFGNIIKGG